MNLDFSDGVLTVFLDGEIDHHTAPSIRETIDEKILQDKPRVLKLDYGSVTFMDSSGIGLIMGRYKLINSCSGEIEVVNIPKNMEKVVKLSGIEKLGKVTVKED
ncbi:MAG: STAS domain-containing protein [Ruminococcaceae bacterium]|nr:STAS domain-containing protein [Oscillospiraceae bacterium]